MSIRENDDPLTVEVSDDGILEVAGDIDMEGAPVLESAILKLEQQSNNGSQNDLVIDLGEVLFIDSSGLRILLGAAQRLRDQGRNIVLRSTAPSVRRLLEITGTTDQFQIGNQSD